MTHKPPPRPTPSREPRDKQDWISRALARAGILSQAEAEEAVRAGRVRLSGRVVRQPFAVVQPGEDIRLDGHRVQLRRQTRVLLFHKPAGVVTAPEDAHSKGDTAFTLLSARLPPELQGYGWHAVGRLDRLTTGLLLFTNDERFVAHATSPATHLPRRYVAEVQGGATEEKLEPLRRGMVLDDGPTRPAEARCLDAKHVAVTLTEGRFHQVKRMLGTVGLPVRRLHREAVGTLTLDVAEGEFRELSAEELQQRLGFSSAAQPR